MLRLASLSYFKDCGVHVGQFIDTIHPSELTSTINRMIATAIVRLLALGVNPIDPPPRDRQENLIFPRLSETWFLAHLLIPRPH